jgi:tRNA 2-thiouridine synthesizing protein A
MTLLDLTGLKCPLPALKTRKALKGMAPGETLSVRSTDPLAGIDIPALLNETGDRLVSTVREPDGFLFTIEKAGEKAGG